MKTSLIKAIQLILSANPELLDILSVTAEMGITAEADSFVNYTEWYISANTGMGACLVMAEEMGAYILTDKATFLTFQANGGVM